MKRLQKFWRQNKRMIWIPVCFIALISLMFYKLGSLTGGVSAKEYMVATQPIGWHGLYLNALNFPMQFVRSMIAWMDPNRGMTLLRAPNAVFGMLAVVSFAWLLKVQHGLRTAILGTLLFSTSAFVLHISRIASFDVIYLASVPLLLASIVTIQKMPQKSWPFILSALVWSALLTTPGLIWLVAWIISRHWEDLASSWQNLNRLKRFLVASILSAWVVPVGLSSWRDIHNLGQWLGLPKSLPGPLDLTRNIIKVPYHLFVRGPHDPTLWLDHTPILDFFTLLVCVIGLYFYIRHWQSNRSKLVGGVALIGTLLIGVAGPVSLALLVPLLYICAATGVAYLIHEWLKTFPVNPIARVMGITMVLIAVLFSCTYNLRAYFVAWPNNNETFTAFSHHLKS